jgi:hypothetical protein
MAGVANDAVVLVVTVDDFTEVTSFGFLLVKTVLLVLLLL